MCCLDLNSAVKHIKMRLHLASMQNMIFKQQQKSTSVHYMNMCIYVCEHKSVF